MTTIRRASLGDAPELAELHLDVWEDGYTGLVPQSVLDARREVPAEERVATWEARIAATPTWVAEDAGRLVGFAHAGPGRDQSGGLELMALYVRARVYGAGIGHRLLRAAIGDAPAYLWVLDGNARAISFYQRQGFAFDGTSKDCDEGPESRMVRR